jgi:long-chain acyl-CoA synthetase
VQKLLLIANPAASGFTGGLHRRVVAILRKTFEVETVWPTNPGDVEAIAMEATHRGIDVVVAMGGDGVVHHVVNGICGSDTALGIIPAGTTNVLARILNLPPKPIPAARFLAQGGPVIEIPLARVEATTDTGTMIRYATFATGVGLDAEAVRAANAEPYRKYRFGGIHYARTAANVVLNSFVGRSPHVRVESEARTADAVSVLVQIHAPYTYFGRFPLAVTRRHPEHLAAMIVERISLMRVPSILFYAAFGRALDRVPGVHVWEDVRELTVHADPPGSLQADGETLGEVVSATISAAPRAVRTLAPLQRGRRGLHGRYAVPLPAADTRSPQTIAAGFQQRSRDWADETAWYEKRNDGWVGTTWSEVRSRVEELAAGLIELGVERGDRVALSGPNTPDWVAFDYAVQHAGAISVPLYEAFAPEQVEYVVAHSGSKWYFAGDADQLEKADGAACPQLERIIAGHLQDHENGRIVGLGRLTTLGRRRLATDRSELEDRVAAVEGDDLFSIVYTPGTTGSPKGAMLTHHNAVWTMQRAVERMRMNREETLVSYLPLSHVFERMVTTALIAADYPVRPVYYFVPDIRNLAGALQAARPTVFIGVPRTWEKLRSLVIAQLGKDTRRDRAVHRIITAAIAGLRRRDSGGLLWPHHRLALSLAARRVGRKVLREVGLDRCWYAVSGATALGPDVQYFWQALGLPLHEGWGMTETSAVSAVQAPDDLTVGVVGRLINGLELRLADDGEIFVRGDSVFPGYYGQPDATASVLDDHGWLATGDVGQLTSDGRLRIVDRKRDLIVTTGGKTVAPQELEKRLTAHLIIEEAMVVGDGRPHVAALLALRDDETSAYLRRHDLPDSGTAEARAALHLHVQTLVDQVNRRFSRAERIRAWTVVPGGFPLRVLTPTSRLRRKVAAEHFAGEIEDLYKS